MGEEGLELGGLCEGMRVGDGLEGELMSGRDALNVAPLLSMYYDQSRIGTSKYTSPHQNE